MTTLGVVTVVTVGVMVGVEFAVAVFVNPIVDRLPADGGLVARGDGARLLGRVMPFWYAGSILLAVLWALLGRGEQVTVIVAGALLAVSVLLSVVLLVPINTRAAHWRDEGAPSDWREQLRRWDRWHLLRLVVIGAAFVLLTVAVTR